MSGNDVYFNEFGQNRRALSELNIKFQSWAVAPEIETYPSKYVFQNPTEKQL